MVATHKVALLVHIICVVHKPTVSQRLETAWRAKHALPSTGSTFALHLGFNRTLHVYGCLRVNPAAGRCYARFALKATCSQNGIVPRHAATRLLVTMWVQLRCTTASSQARVVRASNFEPNLPVDHYRVCLDNSEGSTQHRRDDERWRAAHSW